MIRILKIVIVLLFINIGSLRNDYRQPLKNTEIKNPCMPGFILIVYIGESSAPIRPVLMRTNNEDSTYYKRYIGEGREMFLKNDFIIDEGWDSRVMEKFIISENNYFRVKKYIVEHNTIRHEVEHVNDYSSTSPFKIILSDKCDSIVYIVNNQDRGYFKQLIDSTDLSKNNKIKYSLDYFRRIQDD